VRRLAGEARGLGVGLASLTSLLASSACNSGRRRGLRRGLDRGLDRVAAMMDKNMAATQEDAAVVLDVVQVTAPTTAVHALPFRVAFTGPAQVGRVDAVRAGLGTPDALRARAR
jgi:hypothetical protein